MGRKGLSQFRGEKAYPELTLESEHKNNKPYSGRREAWGDSVFLACTRTEPSSGTLLSSLTSRRTGNRD